MPVKERKTAYMEMLEALPIEPEKLVKYKFPARYQRRMKRLLALNRENKMTDADENELRDFLAANAAVTVLKAKAFAAVMSKA